MCTATSAGCHLPAIVCLVDGHCSWLPPPTQPHGGVCMRAPPSVLVAVCSLHAAATIVCLVVVLESHHCRRWLPPPTQPNGGVGVSHTCTTFSVGCRCSLHAAAAIVCLICCCAVENHHCRRWLPPPTQPNGGVGVSHTCTTFSVGCRLLSACCRRHCLSYLLRCRKPSLPPLVTPIHQPNGGVGVSHTCTDINSVAVCSLQIQMC